ncbi:hypothetical protein [Formosa sp. A9]|uniref:hypothetical protein n=1 Tax=Formosa sp. A9 TaxID=3442641 RepID=UPI003EBB8D54
MKQFLKLLVIFIAPILIIGGAIEVLLRQIPNDYKQKAAYLSSNANTIETLILGSSHSLYGINPDYLKGNAFNASFVSQTPDVDWAILQQYQNQLTNLKTIIIRLSYASLFETLSETNEAWRLKDYNLYFHLQQDYTFKQHSELLSVKLQNNLNRIYNYYVLGVSETSITQSGWGINAHVTPPENLEQAGINVAQRHTISDLSQYHFNTDNFKAIAAFCETRNIQLVVITLPGYKSYNSYMDKTQWQKTEDFGKFLDSTYTTCTYLNFLNDESFTAQDFFDGDHLNAQGAKKLSVKLQELLK